MAVLIDATLIRIVLVPSAMALLGHAQLVPAALAGWLPRIGVEGAPQPAEAAGDWAPAPGTPQPALAAEGRWRPPSRSSRPGSRRRDGAAGRLTWRRGRLNVPVAQSAGSSVRSKKPMTRRSYSAGWARMPPVWPPLDTSHSDFGSPAAEKYCGSRSSPPWP